MKRARITYLIALPAAVLVLAGAAYATASANTDTGRSAADQVRTAERTLLRAELDADTHTAGRLLAPESTTTPAAFAAASNAPIPLTKARPSARSR